MVSPFLNKVGAHACEMQVESSKLEKKNKGLLGRLA